MIFEKENMKVWGYTIERGYVIIGMCKPSGGIFKIDGNRLDADGKESNSRYELYDKKGEIHSAT